MQWMTDSRVGWITIAAGVVAIIVLIGTLGVAGGSGLIGFVGDIMVSVLSILIIPLFIRFGAILSDRGRPVGQVVQVLGVAGALIRLTSSVLLIVGVLPYERTVIGEEVGFVLVGAAILLFFSRVQQVAELSRSYVWFGIILGLAFLASLLALIMGDQLFTQIIDGTVPLSEANPLILVTLFIFTPVQLLGYPIWLIVTGRHFLRMHFEPRYRPI